MTDGDRESRLSRYATDADPSSRVLLHNISWELYEQLRDDEANWGIRMAYDRGELELMSPSQRHEEIGYRFELFMVALVQALGFKCKLAGKYDHLEEAED